MTAPNDYPSSNHTTGRPIAAIIAEHRAARTAAGGGRAGVSRRAVIQTGAATATALGIATVGARHLVAAQDATDTPAAGTTATSCVALTPELTEGPYYVDEALVRSDVTDDREGLPLALTITVQDVVACAPLADAAVEIWHCDARGYYSGVSSNNPGSDSSAEEVAAAAESMFLRGVQISDAAGSVTFDTIYPGWYMGRTVHIHMKVHVGGTVDGEETYEDGTTAHTGQLFVDDEVSSLVFATDAYANRPDDERTYNEEDGILGDHDDDPEFLVALTQVDDNDITAGFTGAVTIGVDPSAVQTSGGGMGGGPGGGQPPAGGPGGAPGDPADSDEASPSASPSA